MELCIKNIGAVHKIKLGFLTMDLLLLTVKYILQRCISSPTDTLSDVQKLQNKTFTNLPAPESWETRSSSFAPHVIGNMDRLLMTVKITINNYS